MIRIETELSQKVVNELSNYTDSLFYGENNKSILLDKKIGIYCNFSKSTRTVYVVFRNHETFEDCASIRISDHRKSFKTDSVYNEMTFEDFDIKKIKAIYNNLNN